MRTLIGNIGTLGSGDNRRPLPDADAIRIEGGRIAAVGTGLEDGADTVIDAKGSPVLIDGQIRIGRSRNTPPAARAAEVVKGLGRGGGGH